MEIEAKLNKSKKLIFSAWVIALSWDIVLQILSSYGYIEYRMWNAWNDSWWLAVVFIFATGLLLYGLWLGSRGIGEPLSLDWSWNLLFGYPCWVPVSIYLVINFIIPIVYNEFIG